MLAISASSPRLTAANAARALLMFALALSVVACGGGDSATAPKPNTGGNTQTPAAVASISITPSVATLAINGTQQLTATVRDANGVELSGRAMSFSSSAVNIASVSQSGLVTAVAAGQATVTVTSEGKSADASITVQPPAPAVVASVTLTPATLVLDAGESSTLSARVADANNNAITGRTVTWTSATPAWRRSIRLAR